MAETMILIPGRTAKQGTALIVGKLKGEYPEITSTVEMNVDDMARLKLNEGDKVRLRSEAGETVVSCTGRKVEDLPSGILFLPYGPHTSLLMSSDTAGTGMPLSKNLSVEVENAGK